MDCTSKLSSESLSASETHLKTSPASASSLTITCMASLSEAFSESSLDKLLFIQHIWRRLSGKIKYHNKPLLMFWGVFFLKLAEKEPLDDSEAMESRIIHLYHKQLSDYRYKGDPEVFLHYSYKIVLQTMIKIDKQIHRLQNYLTRLSLETDKEKSRPNSIPQVIDDDE